MAQNNDVDVNTLIKVYNNKISTLTNQNILLEAKLQTIVQDHLDAQKELLAEKLEIQEKYENLLAEIEEEEEDGKTSN
jgi:U3 small nucleolar ribonucleoprotein component